MTKKEHLTQLFKAHHISLKKIINDITEEESLERGKDNINHIRWQTGHLIGSAGMRLRSLGREVSVPDNYMKLFKRGDEIADDPSVYPPLSELKEKLYSMFTELNDTIVEFSDDDLDNEIEIVPGYKTTIMGSILFLCNHDFYHAGQIAILRKVLGKIRVFG
ncbi:MAG: DinB family protein [candidate division Zixibacteria bacterium]|nr:DinB family protein [candidate division Zixibacteria bacterium]